MASGNAVLVENDWDENELEGSGEESGGDKVQRWSVKVNLQTERGNKCKRETASGGRGDGMTRPMETLAPRHKRR